MVVTLKDLTNLYGAYCYPLLDGREATASPQDIAEAAQRGLAAIEDFARERQTLRAQVQELKAECDKANARADKAEHKHSTVMAEYMMADSNNASLRHQLAEQVKEIDELERERDQALADHRAAIDEALTQADHAAHYRNELKQAFGALSKLAVGDLDEIADAMSYDPMDRLDELCRASRHDNSA